MPTRVIAALQHVEAFDDHDVGPAHDLRLAGHDVVDDVGVDGRLDVLLARLHLGHELHEAAEVVALGEPLAAHDVALFEHRVREEEAVGRDEVDLRVVRPPGEERLEDAGGGALADRDAAGDADYIGDPRGQAAEERVGDRREVLARRHVEVQQPGKRQVDVGDLVERQALVDAPQRVEVLLVERERRRRPQRGPRRAIERQIGGQRVAVGLGGDHGRERSVPAVSRRT